MMKIKLNIVSLLIIVLIALAIGMMCNNVIVEGLANAKGAHKKTAMAANPKGVPRSQIPNGDEHLYILKSQVVPPVCPACPENLSCPREKPAPPCPPCARCPEPSFDCKKVPNYQSGNEQYLPKPMLSNFSSF
jgi:hypothetical protein